jgi:hypothetical protein
MKLIGSIIPALAATGIVLLFLCPPWMCIDPESEGRVHAALGYHAIWHQPSSEFAFRTLYPDAADLPSAERLADFVPRINRVQFTVSALALALTAGLSHLLLRRRSGGRN